MYASNSSSHPSALIGGLSPANDHDVIDSPDLVSLVIPPSTTIEKVQAAQNASHLAREREDCRESPAAMPASGPRRGGAGRGSEEVEKKSGRAGRRDAAVAATSGDDDDDEELVADVGIKFGPVRRRAAWASAAATKDRNWLPEALLTATLREAVAKEEPGKEQARRGSRAIVFAIDDGDEEAVAAADVVAVAWSDSVTDELASAAEERLPADIATRSSSDAAARFIANQREGESARPKLVLYRREKTISDYYFFARVAFLFSRPSLFFSPFRRR